MLMLNKLRLVICLIILSPYSYGQQFLWSTSSKFDAKQITIDKVFSEVLEFYDLYEYYYDGAGYNKESFWSYFEDYGGKTSGWSDLKSKIDEINELTILAFRGNLGRGSIILVISVDKENINLVAFSNIYDPDAISSDSYSRKKFVRWYKSLLNYSNINEDQLDLRNIDRDDPSNPELPTLDDIIFELSDESLNEDDEPIFLDAASESNDSGIFGRKVIYRDPGMIRLMADKSGTIVFEVCIDRRGVVSSLQIDELRTTIKDSKTLRKALDSMGKYKYEEDYTAPKEQCGSFTIEINNY